MCRPKALFEVVKGFEQKDDDKKADLRKAVEDIGFGGLLMLNTSILPQTITPWLIEAFSQQSFIFRASLTKEFVLSKDYVYDMFCLPRGPEKVSLIETGNRFTSTKDPLKVKWRKMFHVKGSSKVVPLAKIVDILKAKEQGDDEFKRLFVMLAMSSFLAPTSNYQTDFSLLYALEDVLKIRKFDWCEYVFNKLISGFYKHKVRGKAFCGGCLLFLMLEYFHRIKFCGEVLSSELPLIQHWNDTDLSVKVKQVYSSGGLGNGLMSKTEFPICKTSYFCDGGRTSMPGGESKVQEALPPRPSAAQSKLKVVNTSSSASPSSSRLLIFELPEGMETNEEIHQRAAGDEIQELFLQLKRNTDVIHLFHLKHLNAITERFVDAFGDSAINLSPTQRFSKDPGYYTYINSLIAKMREVREATDFLAEFGISSQMPSRTSEGDFVVNTDVEAGSPSHVIYGFDEMCYGGLDSVVLKACDIGGNERVEEATGSDFARDAVSFVRPQLSSEILPYECCWVSLKGVGHDGLGCSIYCGLVDRNEFVMSNFLIEYKDVLSSMLTLRKQVADY